MTPRTQTQSGMFRSLRVRNYRLFFYGGLVSNTGTWMQRIAQDWLVLSLTGGNAFALGIVTFLQFAPTLLVGLYAGILADRLEKQRLLAATQAVAGLSALALGTLDVSGVVQLWHVYAIAAVLGFATAMEAPARQAFASELVGRDNLANAVGLNSSSFNAARLVGPAIAGVLIGWIDTGPVFLINAASCVVIVVSLLRIDRDALHRSPPLERGPGQLREALNYTKKRADLVLIIALACMVSLFGLNMQVLVPLMAREVFDKGATEFGLLSSALAVGTLFGALVSAKRAGRPRQRLLIGAALAFGVMLVLLAFMPNFLTFALVLMPAGATSMLFIIAANTSLQLGLDPEMRGRVMSLHMLFFLGGGALGSPLVGWVSEQLSVRTAFAACGVVTVIAAAVAGWVLARRSGGIRLRARFGRRPRLQLTVGAERALGRPEAVDVRKAS